MDSYTNIIDGRHRSYSNNKNDLDNAWKEKGEALFSKVKSLGAKIEKYEGDVPFLALNPTFNQLEISLSPFSLKLITSVLE